MICFIMKKEAEKFRFLSSIVFTLPSKLFNDNFVDQLFPDQTFKIVFFIHLLQDEQNFILKLVLCPKGNEDIQVDHFFLTRTGFELFSRLPSKCTDVHFWVHPVVGLFIHKFSPFRFKMDTYQWQHASCRLIISFFLFQVN